MLERTVLVTGATSGIGLATAVQLATSGVSVAMANRPGSRSDEAVAAVRAAAGGSTEVPTFAADLSSQAGVMDLAVSIQRRVPRLDALVHNAGVYMADRTLSVDGIEMNWAVNVMAPFLLTNLVRDLLIASAPARVIIVSSVGHKYTDGIQWDDLRRDRGYDALEVYNESKLASLMLSYEMAGRFEKTGVTVNALHPGAVKTSLIKAPLDIPWYWKAVKAVATPFILTPERGAATSVYLATSPDIADVTGRYFVRKKARKSSAASYDKAEWARVWQSCEQMTVSGTTRSSE